MPPISQHGNLKEIAAKFGGHGKLVEAFSGSRNCCTPREREDREAWKPATTRGSIRSTRGLKPAATRRPDSRGPGATLGVTWGRREPRLSELQHGEETAHRLDSLNTDSYRGLLAGWLLLSKPSY